MPERYTTLRPDDVDWRHFIRLESRIVSVKVNFYALAVAMCSALQCFYAVLLFTDVNLVLTMKKIYAVLVLAGLANVAAAADVVGDPKAAPAKIEMCIGCHAIPGYKATFPEVFQVPMIGGQSAKYIENALKGYQKGERKHPSMKGIAASLSDQDIADIAAYYSQQSKTAK